MITFYLVSQRIEFAFFCLFLTLSLILSTKLSGSDDSDWSTKVTWRLCRWLIGRNLFWNSIVNKPHINLVALALTIQRKMHLHGIKSSYKPCPFIHVNRIFYFEKIVFIDGGRTAEKDDDFISGKKIRYFDPWWPWWTSSNSPQEFSLKDFFRDTN